MTSDLRFQQKQTISRQMTGGKSKHKQISHYSESQIFVQKFNFDKPPNIFTSFSAKKIENFLEKSKLNFWTKNEDFEQCVRVQRPNKNLGN